jgi:small subunit ribosomal protein S17
VKTFIGQVVSDKMEKTVVVKVDVLWQHPLYKKRVKRSKKYLAHDEKGVKVGQKVKIGETRPMSKRKRWKILEVITA